MGTNQELNQGKNEVPRNKPIKMVFKRNTKNKRPSLGPNTQNNVDGNKVKQENTLQTKKTYPEAIPASINIPKETNANSSNSSSDNNGPNKKLSITLCKVSKSSDCYAVKSSTDSESESYEKLRENSSTDSSNHHNEHTHGRENANSAQQRTHSPHVPKTPVSLKKNKRKRKLDKRDSECLNSSPSLNKERKRAKHGTERETAFPVNNSSSSHLTASSENNDDDINNAYKGNKKGQLGESINGIHANQPMDDKASNITSPHKFHKNMQYFGTGKLLCPDLGDEWYFEQIVRQQGKSAGNFDVYYYSPCKTRLRSKLKLQTFIGDKMDISNFDYNAGRFLKPGETIPKKDALCSDKLQYFSEQKPEKITKPKTPNLKIKTPTAKAKTTKKSTPLVTRITNPKKKKLLAFTPIQHSDHNEPSNNDSKSSETANETQTVHNNSESSLLSSSEPDESFKTFKEEVGAISMCNKDFNLPEFIELAWECLGTCKKESFKSCKNNMLSSQISPLPNFQRSRFLPKNAQKLTSTKKFGKRSVRCRDCPACLAPNCGSCSNCKDMKIYGGNGTRKQGCVMRKCHSRITSKKILIGSYPPQSMVPQTLVLPNSSTPILSKNHFKNAKQFPHLNWSLPSESPPFKNQISSYTNKQTQPHYQSSKLCLSSAPESFSFPLLPLNTELFPNQGHSFEHKIFEASQLVSDNICNGGSNKTLSKDLTNQIHTISKTKCNHSDNSKGLIQMETESGVVLINPTHAPVPFNLPRDSRILGYVPIQESNKILDISSTNCTEKETYNVAKFCGMRKQFSTKNVTSTSENCKKFTKNFKTGTNHTDYSSKTVLRPFVNPKVLNKNCNKDLANKKPSNYEKDPTKPINNDLHSSVSPKRRRRKATNPVHVNISQDGHLNNNNLSTTKKDTSLPIINSTDTPNSSETSIENIETSVVAEQNNSPDSSYSSDITIQSTNPHCLPFVANKNPLLSKFKHLKLFRQIK